MPYLMAGIDRNYYLSDEKISVTFIELKLASNYMCREAKSGNFSPQL
jgi:hypothetical protein